MNVPDKKEIEDVLNKKSDNIRQELEVAKEKSELLDDLESKTIDFVDSYTKSIEDLTLEFLETVKSSHINPIPFNTKTTTDSDILNDLEQKSFAPSDNEISTVFPVNENTAPEEPTIKDKPSSIEELSKDIIDEFFTANKEKAVKAEIDGISDMIEELGSIRDSTNVNEKVREADDKKNKTLLGKVIDGVKNTHIISGFVGLLLNMGIPMAVLSIMGYIKYISDTLDVMHDKQIENAGKISKKAGKMAEEQTQKVEEIENVKEVRQRFNLLREGKKEEALKGASKEDIQDIIKFAEAYKQVKRSEASAYEAQKLQRENSNVEGLTTFERGVEKIFAVYGMDAGSKAEDRKRLDATIEKSYKEANTIHKIQNELKSEVEEIETKENLNKTNQIEELTETKPIEEIIEVENKKSVENNTYNNENDSRRLEEIAEAVKTNQETLKQMPGALQSLGNISVSTPSLMYTPGYVDDEYLNKVKGGV